MLPLEPNSKFQIVPSHVALLVPSAKKAAAVLSSFGFKIGPEEIWEGEGTREIYIQREQSNSLLLMEPVGPGAYQRALEKRGPGVHHLAIDVLNLEAYIESVASSGWLLHPKSVASMQRVKTAYFARPGFPGLIEVQQNDQLKLKPLFVEEISISFDESLNRLLGSIGLDSIVKNVAGPTALSLNGRRVSLEGLL